MDESHARFRQEVLPHLDAAYNLARWIVGADAEDVVQEAMIRAFKAFHQWRGGNARAWVLMIVRNCCFTWKQSARPLREAIDLDKAEPSAFSADGTDDPGAVLQRKADVAAVRAAIAALPVEFREIILLREFELLDYKQIAQAVGVPVGTVMSRLSRARERLRAALATSQEAG